MRTKRHASEALDNVVVKQEKLEKAPTPDVRFLQEHITNSEAPAEVVIKREKLEDVPMPDIKSLQEHIGGFESENREPANLNNVAQGQLREEMDHYRQFLEIQGNNSYPITGLASYLPYANQRAHLPEIDNIRLTQELSTIRARSDIHLMQAVMLLRDHKTSAERNDLKNERDGLKMELDFMRMERDQLEMKLERSANDAKEVSLVIDELKAVLERGLLRGPMSS
ncbi:hypothetical protein HD806DRAFT_527258 [Xylariaceae sp. AK1471]|nr:hypothetical protein HD806DRAFT_527258 [Xylariaceae sp. AK1471]